MKRRDNIVLGVIFLVIACFYIMQQMPFYFGVGLWDVVWFLIGAILIYSGVTSKSYYSLFFGFAFIIEGLNDIMYLPFFHNFNLWNLGISAILFSLAFTYLFPIRRSYKGRKTNPYEKMSSYDYYRTTPSSVGQEVDEETVIEVEVNESAENDSEGFTYKSETGHAYTNSQYGKQQGYEQYSSSQQHQYYQQSAKNAGDNILYLSTTMGNIKKFVRASEFEGGEVNCTFGAIEVDFSHSDLSQDGAMLNVSCSFGKITLFIPRIWAVQNNISTSLGAVNDDRLYTNDVTMPRLILNGNVSFGEVAIIYI